MQRGGQGGGGFPGFDPFADFGGFGGFGGHQSLVSSFFGGRSPFDDPFFSRPFGSGFDSMFERNMFGPSGSPFAGAAPTGPARFIQNKQPQHNKRRGPVIEELDSDDEKSEDGPRDGSRKHHKHNKEPHVVISDDEADGWNQQIQHRNEFSNIKAPQSQSQCFTFQSSTVSYGGTNGQFYTKSMTKRAGSDGVSFEEFREADSSTGQANHRVTRGLHNKGHTLARKLSSDGRVDSMQTLHNLNEDELAGFEQAWEGKAWKYLPGWKHRLEGGNVEGRGGGSAQMNRGGWALPSTQSVDLDHVGSSNPHMGNSNEGAYLQQTGRRVAGRGSRRG